MNKKISFGSIEFHRNGVLASGILGVTGASLARVALEGAGGVTTKSISYNERKGHATPVVQVFNEGLINAVGLSSTGVNNSNNELLIARTKTDVVIIASVFGSTLDEFKQTIEALDPNNINAIELNISCPNVQDEFGAPFAATPQSASSVMKHIKNSTKLPIIVKLSPNFPNIGDIAKAVEAEGANGITAINTVGPGMLIDINTALPRLSNKRGGVSGPAILPIAIRCVYDIYKAVKIPIIGMGGITNIEDAIQMIMAGATLYGVGTGILYKGLSIFNEINNGIDAFLKFKKLDYSDLIGMAHKS